MACVLVTFVENVVLRRSLPIGSPIRVFSSVRVSSRRIYAGADDECHPISLFNYSTLPSILTDKGHFDSSVMILC